MYNVYTFQKYTSNKILSTLLSTFFERYMTAIAVFKNVYMGKRITELSIGYSRDIVSKCSTNTC